MKTIKKILSVAVSLMMVFSLMTVVKAEETTYTITAPTNTTHTYEVYQIFKGELSTKEDGTKVLSNVEAGENFKADKEVDDALDAFGQLTGSEAQRAAAIAEYVDLTGEPITTVNGGGSVEVDPGYYLIKDKATTVGTNDAFTLYIIQVVGNVQLNAKTGKPEVEKKVLENSNNQWQDGADYNIGDNVPFKLTATIGENIDKFDTYYLRFNDTLSKGLTLNASSIKVVIADGETETQLANNKYYIYGDQNEFQVVIYDLKTVGVNVSSGTKVIVTYTAKLNSNAEIGNPGNPNEVTLTYSNNPNVTTPTTPTNPDKPGTPDKPENPENPETPDKPQHPETPDQPNNPGETTKDVVVVFTYELDVNKVNEAKEPLKGAGFTLYKGDVAIGEEIKGTDLTTFKWEGLDAGEYTLKETTTPEGYNTVKDIEFEIVGTYENPSDKSVLTKLVVKANDEVVSEGDKATFTADIASGVVATNVVNKAGSTLPETGGRGTTMLYVGGSVLMLGAAILLVSKKRMQA